MNIVNSKKATISFCFLMVASFVFYAFFYTQIIPYMEQLGFSKVDRGYILSLGAILGILSQILVGSLADHLKKVKLLAIVMLILFVLCISVMYLKSDSLSLWHLSIIVAINAGFYYLHNNFIELWAFQSHENVRNNFGLIRLFGSIGWALASIIVGIILNYYSFKILGIIMFVIGIFILIIQLTIPDVKLIHHQKFGFSDLISLLKNKTFMRNLLVCFLLFVGQQADAITVIEKMVSLNSSSSIIGLKWMICALVELPLMFLGIRLIVKHGYRKIINVVAVVFIIRMVLNGLATTPLQLAFITSLQFATFPLLLLSQKYMAIDDVKAQCQNSSIMIMTAIGTNLPVILIPLIQSLTANFLDLSSLCYVFAFLAFLALIINRE